MARRLGVRDAVVVGLGAMLGAGVFSAWAPAAAAAGSGLLLGLAVAAVVAACNATSSARLAAVHPESGGTYAYGRLRLGEFWGFLAGWAFVVGKSASCAAMALTFATQVAPEHARPLALAAVAAITALDSRGVQKSARVTRLLVVAVLLTLAVVVVAALGGGTADADRLRWEGVDAGGVLSSAGLLFFAFAGYARIATLGEEVRDPARTIPRAVPIALAVTFAVYAAVGVAVLAALGPDALAAGPAPLRRAVEAGSAAGWAPLVAVGGALAALGSLLTLLLGVSRTTFAMARQRDLPPVLAVVHPVHGVPHRAALAVGALVAVLVTAVDLRDAIGFSSFGVLVYYAIANASAWTLTREQGRPPRFVPALGLLGCVVLALSLPAGPLAGGAAVLGAGALVWWVRARYRARRRG
ncbi:amino acid permease [Kineococcus sp. T13]|uniref:APC family permease n=1 Tax=Kineococcus vitellinus TaxID=2696565 RepID=UPI001412FF6E|nr:amino acid permease [Kineococcus vitellinus]